MTDELDELLWQMWLDEHGEEDFDEHKTKIKQAIQALIEEAYKKGYIDGGIDVINGRSTPLKVQYLSKKEIAELQEENTNE